MNRLSVKRRGAEKVIDEVSLGEKEKNGGEKKKLSSIRTKNQLVQNEKEEESRWS